jgi:hypothetical protein
MYAFRWWRRIGLAAGLALGGLCFRPATAQIPSTSGPRTGGVPGANFDILRHRDLTGKPCLNIAAISRAHVINPKLFDHVIAIDNHCSQLIKVRVCYSGSEHCIPLDVTSHGRKEAVLGTMPSMPQFRYDFKEQF